MMMPPTPTLTYTWRGNDRKPDPHVAATDGPQLFAVHEASASADRTGSVHVWLRGPMRKADGTRGRHERSVRVDTDATGQPDWLIEVIRDATRRLA